MLPSTLGHSCPMPITGHGVSAKRWHNQWVTYAAAHRWPPARPCPLPTSSSRAVTRVTMFAWRLSQIPRVLRVPPCPQDVKPENIMFDSEGANGVLKVLDFGSSAFVQPNEMVGGDAVGKQQVTQQ